MNKRAKKIFKAIAIVLCLILLFLSLLGFYAAKWYIDVYGEMGFDAVLYTLFNGLGGVQDGLVNSFLAEALPPSLVWFILLAIVFFFSSKRKIILTIAKKIKLPLYPFNKAFSGIASLIISGVLLFQAASDVGIWEYIQSMTQESALFQEKYVDPLSANITFPKKKKNLIYIYLESMETTFFSKEHGGALNTNQIPELYKLAKENTNFSNNQDIGGFRSSVGSSWTIGALVAQTTGLPLKSPSNEENNSYGKDSFLPGATSITDILKENGYYQAFMIGSDKSFGNRDQYFSQHGVDKIYDLNTARTDGIIPEDYHVWWGMEDLHLYRYAKQELIKIAKKDQPFSFSMLTVDTHHIGGYFCSECKKIHEEQYDNVYNCASKQLYNFVDWLKQQDFYENTTIIICGDHRSMDQGYMNRNLPENYDRHIYNCFINPSAKATNTKNRIFTAMDLFPTTLTAIGCTFDGDRLGIGTDMFSNSPTIAEEMGSIHLLNDEIQKNSSFYLSEFILG